MKKYLLFFVVLVSLACKKPYTPEVVESNVNLLVVEGFINVNDQSTIRLSRTTSLKSPIAKMELNSVVTVESDKNESFPLSDQRNGNYLLPYFPTFSASNKYRLRIKTMDGSIYLSDYVQPKLSPPIDNVGWEVKSNGLQVNASSHDDSNSTRYYRFEYDETWQFVSRYNSRYIYSGSAVRQRTDAEDIYSCYGHAASTSIVLASTARLSNDVLSNAPVVFIGSGDERTKIKYSIEVTQYPITEEAYKYWETLKKNTEDLGSIFGPQPSFISGNLKCISKPEEKVLGFISVGSRAKKRIFIDAQELPSDWKLTDANDCKQEFIVLADQDVFYIKRNSFIPIVGVSDDTFNLIGYFGANINCVDCTLRGTKTKPIFWP